jgi:hypothetical protein
MVSRMVRVPHIDKSTLSEADRQHAHTLWLLFHLMEGFIQRLRNDLELFDYSTRHAFRPDSRKGAWVHIAARDAVITLWDFGDALRQIETAVRSCSAPIRTEKRIMELRAAIGMFGNAFPNAKRMRRVSAHPAGHFGSAQSRKVNAHKGAVGYSNIYNRTITHTHEGRLLSFELTEDSIGKLETIRDAVFKSFRS